jgi:HEAT repeat protein
LEPHKGQGAFIDFAGLVERGRQPSYETQSCFVFAIARSRNPLALNALLELLQVRDVRLQNVVCEALAILGDTRAVPALVELVQQTKNPQALRALGGLRSEASISFLIRTLKNNPEAYLRAEAAEALGRIAVPARGEFARAIPTLASVLTNGTVEDALVQREAMLALARIDDSLAVSVVLEYARRHHSGLALRNLLDVTSITGDTWLMPLLGKWLHDWRYYNLNLDDVQLVLDYLVATSHRDMAQVLVEALQIEISAEVQDRIARALSQISGSYFGDISHPVLNLAMDKSNHQVVNKWQKWWKHAQKDSLFLNQIRLSE